MFAGSIQSCPIYIIYDKTIVTIYVKPEKHFQPTVAWTYDHSVRCLFHVCGSHLSVAIETDILHQIKLNILYNFVFHLIPSQLYFKEVPTGLNMYNIFSIDHKCIPRLISPSQCFLLFRFFDDLTDGPTGEEESELPSNLNVSTFKKGFFTPEDTPGHLPDDEEIDGKFSRSVILVT